MLAPGVAKYSWQMKGDPGQRPQDYMAAGLRGTAVAGTPRPAGTGFVAGRMVQPVLTEGYSLPATLIGSLLHYPAFKGLSKFRSVLE